MSQLPRDWNWRDPDYEAVIWSRAKKLDFLRSTSGALSVVLQAYARPDGFYAFIFDWAWVVDPRLSGFGKEPIIPFVLFPRQVEALTWMEGLVHAPAQGRSGKGNLAKTRGCGASTFAMAWYLWRWRFRVNVQLGVGSNLERNVWGKENPKSLFWKIRHMIEKWPEEFLPVGFDIKKHLRRGESAGELFNPETKSVIHGDAGDDIGRGDRRLIYVIDEHRSLQQPVMAEAALAKTTNTLIRLSTERKGSVFNTQIKGMVEGIPTDGWEDLAARIPGDRPPNWLKKRIREEKAEGVFPFDWHEDPREYPEKILREKQEAIQQGMLSVYAVEVERDVETVSEETFIGADLLAEAAARRPEPSGPVRIAVDIASTGVDWSVIGARRGMASFPQRKFRKTDILGVELGAAVIEMAESFLEEGLTIEAVTFELKEVGYALQKELMQSGLKTVLVPFRPEQRVGDGKHYNLRALAWACWKRALQNGAQCPDDPMLIGLASQLRYEFRTDARGRQVLLMEDKKKFRKRLNTDPDNSTGGPSPDEADTEAMLWLPLGQYITPIDLYAYRRLLGQPDDVSEAGAAWSWA